MLYEAGIHIDDLDNVNNWTSLHYAAFNNCLDVAKFCIENKADPCKMDNDKFTPIYLAANQGHLEMINYLYLYKKGWNYIEAPCKLVHLASK